MEKYQINFNNKVKLDAVTVAYTASYTALNGRRHTIYSGEAIFQRDAVPPLFLKTGEVAIRAIEQVMIGLKRDYQLVKVNFAQPQNSAVLGVPSMKTFSRYLTERKLLHCVPTHNVDGETVVDIKFIQEFRIG
ncbi:hypothetical protein [Loigolactobacillus zhaoyuanensis]|uniref:Uncharacterized protein n=1 Tax=Loigolactobacillus zhaoyuanensis TaxID=2486017 RepID=A0ABW8UCD6_9LACO|nr:hypothetical protein [Loigolactobacillus zhaoyuanensis]